MATVSYQPYSVGYTYGYWDFPMTTDSGNEDLTGVDITKFTMIFRNTTARVPVDTTGTGTFTIKVIYPAEILYKPSPADVASVFNGQLVVKAFYPPSGTNADEVVFDPIPFQITAS